MKRLLLAVILLLCGGITAFAFDYPDWAYGIRPAEPAVPDDGTVFTLPGSDGRFTRSQVFGRAPDGTRIAPADWYPQDHAAMPKLVAEGDNARGIAACAVCHYPNGKGRPQNAALAGLPAAYMLRQLQEMKAGLRHSAEPRKKNVGQMLDYAKAMTEAEMAEIAAYYAALPVVPRFRVVETATVPKMKSAEGLWLPLEAGGEEPIGTRIIETPEDVSRELIRDPRAGFIVHAPPGSVEKGKALVTTGKAANGTNRTMACATCHGRDLAGTKTVPGIAARSPSHMARQLYDFHQGARRGALAFQMTPVVEKLAAEDVVAITAYLASLPPPR
ncbi:MAG TPA: c-type cytochrome [Rhizomicrobium sp.]|nr:c-type cytochrome [Rhizomicrobium sp.]